MTIPLRQSTASQEVPLGCFVDNTDGNTEKTGLTINNTDIKLWKNGATSMVNKNSGGATHMNNGMYYAVLDATDTDTLGGLLLFIHATGSLYIRQEFEVYPREVYDSFFTTGTYLSVNTINNVTVGNVTGSVLGNVNGSVGSVTNPVGISTGTFLDALSDKVWDEQIAGHLVLNTTGYVLDSRMPTGAVVVGVNNDKTGYSLSSLQTFDMIGNISGTLSNVINVINPVGISTGSFILAVADQVWDEAIAGHLGAGSTGEKLNAAGSAADPWGTALPGAYGAGTAGNILGTNLDATVSSRSSHSAADVWAVGSRTLTSFGTLIADIWASAVRTITGGTIDTNNDKTGYTASTVSDKTGYALTAAYDPAKTAAQVSDIPTANQNADALLKRDWTAVTGEAARSVLNALRFIRNKFSTTATPGSVTIYKEDDTTVAYTKSVTTDAAANPIVEG